MTTLQSVLRDCACHKVRKASRTVTRMYDDALRPVGLRATQLSVLAAVGADGAMSITKLAELLGMERSTLTRNLVPLQEDGLVSIGSEGWRRSRTLAITSKGRSKLSEALPIWEHAQKTLKQKLGASNWSDVHNSLDSLLAAI